jgi:hypothetical protein
MGYVALGGTKLIPAPFVGINRQYNRSGDMGEQLSKVLTFNITGKAVKGKGGFTHTGSGYPADDFTQEPLEDLLAKIEDLEALVDAGEWVWLEIQPDPESSAPSTKWYVRPVNLTLPDDLWVNYSDYTLTLEGQVSEDDYVQDVDESWSLVYNEDPLDTYTLTHTLSCTSRAVFQDALQEIKEGWKNSYAHVNDVMGGAGEDGDIINGDPGFALPVSFIAYDHVLTQNIDEQQGIYGLNETWVMSENPYNETQQIVVNTNRDAYPVGSADVTVAISGEVIGFRQDDNSGYDDALNHWETNVEPGLFASASAKLPGGANSLNSEPVTKQVTYNEITRTVSYAYTYDNGSSSCVQDLNVNVSQPDSSCPDITVTVSGSVQGIKTSTETAWAKAQACWATLEPTLQTEAESAYANFGGTGTLRGPYNSTYGQSELNAKITFSRQWIDREFVTLHVVRVSETFDASTDATAMSVDGNITTICSETESYQDVLDEFNANGTEAAAYGAANALYAGFDTLNPNRLSSRVNYDERARSISYSYEFGDRGENGYSEEITYSVQENNSNCGRSMCSMSGTIQGRRTTAAAAYANALNQFNANYLSADPSLVSDYLTNAKRTAKRVTYDEFNNKVSFQYDFNDEEENWYVDETITESWGEECGYATISKSGTVVGICTGGLESAYANAVIGYNTDVKGVVPDGATYLNRRSVGHSKRQGKITYSEEYTNRPNTYKHGRICCY